MIDVVMPQMGESIVEGTLTKWLKKKGDHVERDEPLFEISTDKVDTEIPSPSAGTLSEIMVEEGKTVGINTVVGRISEGANGAGAPAAASQPAAQPTGQPAGQPASQPATQPTAQPAAPPAPQPQATQPVTPQSAPQATPTAPPSQPRPSEPEAPVATVVEETAGPLSPLVRKMARENNIDLSKVKGTGAGGRITKQDLENYLAAPAQPQAQSQAQAGLSAEADSGTLRRAPQRDPNAGAEVATVPSLPPAQQPVASQPPATQAPAAVFRAGEAPATRIEPMSMMRQRIAEHMVFSKRTSAHVTTVHKVDMTRIAKLRDRIKAQFQAEHGFGLTFLPFVLRAATAALRQYPILNASIDGTNVIYHRDINLGIAVALENGLIVPVIRNADEKNVVGLQRAISDLAARARSRQLRPDEVQAGTFSITNFGSFGSVFATPVINQPQVAILGVGAVDKEPVVVEDAIAIRSMCYLALTFDHRLIDGALADQFTGKVKDVLQTWGEEVM
jgi:2-oxoglutarate dehydrogenase E2 component (dihydrolipoamide succinyltransferase)